MKKLVLSLLLAIFLICSVYAPVPLYNKEINHSVLVQMKINVLKVSPFTWGNFNTYLTLVNADHKEVMTRQAILETGNFKSSVFKHNRNLFGMKMPEKRKTTAIAKQKGFAVYNHWTESIDDYIILKAIWKVKRPFVKDGYEELKLAKYAENPKYIELLKQIKIFNYDRTSTAESTSV